MSERKYETHVEPRLLEVSAWAREGMTESKMAQKLGVSYAAFRSYKKQHLALLSTLKENKQIIDIKVENAFLKRALGYTVTELIEEMVFDPKTKQKELQVTKRITKEVAPDVGAAKVWLYNRNRRDWSDNPQAMEIKKKELVLREKEMESKEW